MAPGPDRPDMGLGYESADEAARMVGAAMDLREAAHTGLVLLGRAVAAVHDGGVSERRAPLDQALTAAATDRTGSDFARLLRWMAAALVAAAELAGNALDRRPGELVERVAALRAVNEGRDRRHAGLDHAMGAVVQAVGADAPGARRALEGLAAGLGRSGRRAALAWSAEVTVGLLTLVELAGGRDEVDLLSRLGDEELLDVPGLLAECGLATGGSGPPPDDAGRGPGTGQRPSGLSAPRAAGTGTAGEPRRSRGETVRTVAAERRAIGVLTAVRCGNRPALEATVAELSRREVGEVCTTLAGCVAGAAELADAELEELVDDLAPAAVRLIARQAAAVSHGDAGVDDRLGRWLEHAQPAEVKALVAAFAQAAWSALVLAAAGQGMDPEAYLQRLAAEVAAETAVTGTAAADPCPCRSGLAYGHCCGR